VKPRPFDFLTPDGVPGAGIVAMAAIGVRPEIDLGALAATERAPTLTAAQVGQRRMWFADGWRQTPVYARERLPMDLVLKGPAILEQLDCVTSLGKRLPVMATKPSKRPDQRAAFFAAAKAAETDNDKARFEVMLGKIAAPKSPAKPAKKGK